MRAQPTNVHCATVVPTRSHAPARQARQHRAGSLAHIRAPAQPPESGGLTPGARDLAGELLALVGLGGVNPDEPDSFLLTVWEAHDDGVPVDDASHGAFRGASRLGRRHTGIPVRAICPDS